MTARSGCAANPGRDRGAGSNTRDESSGNDSTAPVVDLSNITHEEARLARLLHEQGVSWWLARLYVAWRRQYPHQHVGPLGSRMLAEAAAAGRARRAAARRTR